MSSSVWNETEMFFTLILLLMLYKSVTHNVEMCFFIPHNSFLSTVISNLSLTKLKDNV